MPRISTLIVFGLITSIPYLSGCKPIILALFGVHQPRQEKIEDIKAYAIKHDIPLENCALVKEDSLAFALMKRMNVPLLFDKTGYLIDFNSGYENKSCGGNILSFIEGLSSITYAPRDSNITYGNETKAWNHLDNLTPYQSEIDSTKFDYAMVYYWNTFSGRGENYKMIRLLRKSIASNPRVKFKLVLVNQDLREGMNEEKFLEHARRHKINTEVK